MEDAHAVVLDLEAPNDKRNSFFAVYDGHGGAPFLSYPIPENTSHINPPGSTVAKFASLNVHKRLVTEEDYNNDEYEAALKKSFLGTDEDILASQFIFSLLSFPTGCICRPCAYKRSFRLYCCCSSTLT
jgi:protein phosphatase 2C family protein 2/3